MITVKNLSIYTNNTVLVKNISFEIKEGEKVVLLGQSGSGKTLTSLALMHLLPANLQYSGTILYDGQPFSKSMRGKFLGMILQSPANCFDQAFTIGTFLHDICNAHFPKQKLTQHFFEEIIHSVGLENPKDILNSYPFQLSGGMLQRIMIGICLALKTKFIIADEATSDIDCLAEQEILNLLKKTQTQKQSMLLITHSIQTACHIADRILFMHKGKLADDFPVQEVHSKNRHHALKDLLSANAQICYNSWRIPFYV